MTARVLVIKLAALGDFVQAFGPFAAIRAHHPDAEITLLTTAAYADFARAAPWFDSVWVDERPRWTHPGGWLNLRRRLRSGGFSRVYDLQTSDRSSAYFQLFRPGPMPEWSGIACGCSHPHANPRRDFLHTRERQAEQLAMAGIESVPAPDLAWIDADIGRFGLAAPYVLLVPGGAAHRPAKRWPIKRYGELADRITNRGLIPVVLGTPADGAAAIAEACPAARDLTGKTAFTDIAALARDATAAVGNDTGPMHLISAAGCPSVVLYSAESDPALCGQRGPALVIVRRDDLAGLSVDDVVARLSSVSG